MNENKNDSIKSVYNNCAHKFEELFMDLKLYKHFIDDFITLLKPGSNILDMGCGPGNILKYLYNKNNSFNLTGIDISEKMLNLARHNIPKARLILSDINKIKLSEKFDAIILSFCIVHSTEEEVKYLLKSANNLLNKNGLIYLSFIEGNGNELAKTPFTNGEKLYFNYFQNDFISKLLEKNNFKIIYNKSQKLGNKKLINEIFIFAEKT